MRLYYRNAAITPPAQTSQRQAPGSWDSQTRTFSATVATETRARVVDYERGGIVEEILVAPGGKFPGQTPLLDSHDRTSARQVVGSMSAFTRSGGDWRGIGQVDESEAEIASKIGGGHLRACSIGYRPSRFEYVPAGQRRTIDGKRYQASADMDLKVTQEWSVHEVSLVSVPADPNATIRSAASPQTSGSPMIFRTKFRTSAPSVGALTAAILQKCGVDPMHRVERSDLSYVRIAPSFDLERDADEGHRLQTLPYLELIRLAAVHDGLQAHRHAPPQEIMHGIWQLSQRFAFATLAVESLLTNSAAAIVLSGYESAEDTTSGWVRETDAIQIDKQMPMPKSNPMEPLERRGRGETAPQATFLSTEENMQVNAFARTIDIDEIDIVNGMIGELFETSVRNAGAAAARVRPDLVYATLLNNPTMSDGFTLFSAEHNNLQPSAALADDKLQDGAKLMRVQQADGVNLNLRPAYLIGPAAIERTAGKLIREQFVEDGQSTPPPIVRTDSRLDNGVLDPRTGTLAPGSDADWYLAAPGQTNSGLVAAYIEGANRAPMVRVSQLSRGQFGVSIDVQHACGVAPVDWRGLVKSQAAP